MNIEEVMDEAEVVEKGWFCQAEHPDIQYYVTRIDAMTDTVYCRCRREGEASWLGLDFPMFKFINIMRPMD